MNFYIYRPFGEAEVKACGFYIQINDHVKY